MLLDEQISTLPMAAPLGRQPLTALMASPPGHSPPQYWRPLGAEMRDTRPSLVGEGTRCWTQPWASPTQLGPACLTWGKTGAQKDATKPRRWQGVWDPDQGSWWRRELQVHAQHTRTQPGGSALLLLLKNQGLRVKETGLGVG